MSPLAQSLVEIAALSAFIVAVGPRRLYRGKILTEPVVRLVERRRRVGMPGRICIRLVAMLLAGDLLLDASPLAILATFHAWYFALYADDMLTGDDDRWKRFKDAARNRVRWLMDLPSRPVEETA